MSIFAKATKQRLTLLIFWIFLGIPLTIRQIFSVFSRGLGDYFSLASL
jgi:hypothetical protein